jgi:meso-butanediol dehydrogenase/(S,S)-butanediol dehydrogenase/diacetyl reductase
MTNHRFNDRVVLITGGSSGIGESTTTLLLAEGAKVFITDLEERDVVSRLGSNNAGFYKCDVSSPEECEAAIKACVEIHGRIDVLFHNAGMLCPPDQVPDQDVAIFQKVLLTNLGGLFYLAKAAIPYMRKQGSGNIIATASTSGLSGAMGISPYAASKAGIINLIKTMALDHAKDGIRVNAVAPGKNRSMQQECRMAYSRDSAKCS